MGKLVDAETAKERLITAVTDTLKVLENEPHGVYECFHCGCRSAVWQCDYDFEDFGYEGEGIVQILHCTNCGAEIEYRIFFGEDDEDDIQRDDI